MFWCVRDIALILMIGLGIVHRIQCFRTRLSCTLAGGAPSIETHEMSTQHSSYTAHVHGLLVLYKWLCGQCLQRVRYHTCLQRVPLS